MGMLKKVNTEVRRIVKSNLLKRVRVQAGHGDARRDLVELRQFARSERNRVFDELSRDAADKIAALIPRRQRPTAT